MVSVVGGRIEILLYSKANYLRGGIRRVGGV